ncbi:AMP-binding protein [Phytomonospora sp. NPDC050363]|uniref:AMP-binding protein n=1 Tax=Phytomonospora sp. NPDC050363 TaxID=3155642 RepID=UPI0033C772C8
MTTMDTLACPTLADAASAFGPRVSVTYPGTGHRLTGAELEEASARFAHGLLGHGVATGDVVGLLLPASPEVLIGLFGVVRSGAAAAMLAPPSLAPERGAELLAPTVRRARMRFLVTHAEHADLADALAALCPGLTVLGTDLDAPGTGALPRIEPDDLAVVQFTSGSTGNPKGVMLTHSVVMAGLRAIVVTSDFTERDVMVSWAPHFHDLGLFGVLAVLLAGGSAQVMSPLAFLFRPLTALRLLSDNAGTLLTGPDFSYRRIVSKLTAAATADLDLSRWRLAYNGAEPVRADTVADFRRGLAPAGVAPSVMYPVYGMAEATLAITFPGLGEVPRVVHVDRALLADHGRAHLLPEGHENAKALVGVGRPVEGMNVRLVDDSGAYCPEGTVGEIQIAGPSVTTGYLHDPQATARAFDGAWLRTGDLGFRLDGDLFIAGRRKEMIVLRGQNHFPEDVEELARTHPGVHRGRCVAFADTDTETIVVVAEVPRGLDAGAVTADLRLTVAQRLGLAEVDVHAVNPGWIPQTSSGKWQRDLARRRIGRRMLPSTTG